MFWTINTVLAGLILAGFGGRFGWPFEILTSLRPQFALILLISALYMVQLGRPVSALYALVFVAVALAGMSQLLRPASPPVADRDLRIVWANVLHKRTALDSVIALADREGADIIVLAEYDGISGRLPDHWPYRLRPDGKFMPRATVLSKIPFADSGYLRIPYRPGSRVTVETEAGPVVIAGVHPHTPMSPGWTRNRNADIAAAAATAGKTPHTVLVGDFNTVTWSSALLDIEEFTPLRRVPYGPWSSWMGRLPLFGLPIDHVFVTPDMTARARVGPGTGSDHLPLIIDIAIAR